MKSEVKPLNIRPREGGLYRTKPVLGFLILAAGYFYSSMQRISAGVILPNMAADYGFSAALVGFLSGLFFYSYGFLQSVWGAINDRYGPVMSCSVGFAITGVGSLVTLVSHDALFIGVSRILCGVGLASVFTGIYLYAALAFPQKEYPIWVGRILLAGNLGTAAAVSPLGWIMDRIGYNGLFIVLAIWAFLLSAVLRLFRRYSPLGADRTGKSQNDGESRLFDKRQSMVSALIDSKRGFEITFSHRPLWVIIFVWAILCAAIMTLQGLWGVEWLKTSSGVNETDARFWISMICMGLVIGSPIGGRVTVMCGGRRKGILYIMTLLGIAWAVYVLGAWMSFPAYAMGVTGVMVGVISACGMVYCSSSLKAMADTSAAGLTIGAGQMIIYALLITFQWVSGIIINRFPGNEPGVYLNRGFLISFGTVTLLVWSSILLIISVPAFYARTSRE
jgi:sugar phosphate permease